MADIRFIIQQVRNVVITNPGLFAKIGTRFIPRRIDYGYEPATYPLISFVFGAGLPDFDNYPSNTHLLEVYFVSETSIDEAIEMSAEFTAAISQTRYTDPVSGYFFDIVEDTKAIDVSGVFGDGKVLYVMTNTMAVKTVE